MASARALESPGDLAIQTEDLRKEYGNKVAVSRLSLRVPRGSIFGFLGPNGAGKSTSVKMLLGLVKPSSGHALLLGKPAGDVQTRGKIGFLPEHFRFYDWLTPGELLGLHGRLCGLSRERLRTRIPEMLEMVGLGPHRDKRVHDFSKGMMQRIGLAQALIHDPEIVFLDEPTSGLDPMGRRLVRDVIRAESRRGATVFLNSHLLSEVEITCDHVAFLKDGEVVRSKELRAIGEEEEVRVSAEVRGLPASAVEGLRAWSTTAKLEGESLRLRVPSREALPDVVRHLVSAGGDIFSFTVEKASLEDLFLEIMGEDRGL